MNSEDQKLVVKLNLFDLYIQKVSWFS